MNPPKRPEALTVLYDGGCPLCRREIAHLQRLAQREGEGALRFVDLTEPGSEAVSEAERASMLARFHVQRADGTRLQGAAAFVEMWSRLPGWRWLARLARLPGMLALLELAYRAFLRLRPAIQSLARRLEAAPPAPAHRSRDSCPRDTGSRASTPSTPGSTRPASPPMQDH